MNKAILCISNFGDFVGGGEHSFFDLVTRLSSDWAPVVLSPEKGELTGKLRGKRIRTHVVPLAPLRPWLLVNVFKSMRAYYRLCRRRNISLIYANGSRAALYGGIVGKILHLPVVWHCRVSRRDPCLDIFLVRLCTRIIANSRATAARFADCCPAKVEVIYNGIDLAWLKAPGPSFPPEVKPDWKVLLVVARVSKLKRHDTVMSAFEAVAKTDEHVHLLCLGAVDPSEAEWWDYLQKKTRQSSFADRIHWLGQVEDVRPWYRIAAALVLPSENESFGRVLVEAMGCGVPVIAAAVGGVPELVNHGVEGFLVPPGNAEKMSEAIRKIIDDYELRESLSRSARKRAEIFSLNAHVEQVERVFKEEIRNTLIQRKI